MGNEEILLRPFGEARIKGRVVRGAGGAQPGVEGLRVLVVGNGRIEVGAAAEPALGRGRKRVFMWTAGTCGLAMCATRLMPVAKKLGSSPAPWMVRRTPG